MLRHLVLALATAILVGTTLAPADALARHHGYWYRSVWYGYGSSSDPRAARAGYQGPHYGRECYRAASGRAICPLIDHGL